MEMDGIIAILNSHHIDVNLIIAHLVDRWVELQVDLTVNNRVVPPHSINLLVVPLVGVETIPVVLREMTGVEGCQVAASQDILRLTPCPPHTQLGMVAQVVEGQGLAQGDPNVCPLEEAEHHQAGRDQQ